MRKLSSRVPVFLFVMPLVLLQGCATVQSGEALRQTFDSGVQAYDAGDYLRAYKIWSTIQEVDLAAMRNVGMMLRKGQGVPRDPKKAEYLFEMAAQAGLPTAQADLADMLIKGEAGAPDPKRALPLLEAAAAANHPIAQFELAQLYEQGGLVPKDMHVARQLYGAAASHGMPEAQARLDELGPESPISAPDRPPPAPTTTASSATPLRPAQP